MAARIRRAGFVLALALLLTTALTGAAWAATLVGTDNRDRQFGTDGRDTIYGLDGNDFISGRLGDDKLGGGAGGDVVYGKRGADLVRGGRGADDLFGSRGNDVIDAADGRLDWVDCGSGNEDRASVDEPDQVHKNCEIVNGEQAH